MKKTCLGILTFFTVLFAGLIVHGQKNNTDARITEVYAAYTKSLTADQMMVVKNHLSRTEIKKQSILKGEKFPLLSSVPLLDKYNPQITKDDFAKPLQINPIKYQISFMETQDQLFRIDGTDYVLVVKARQ